MAPKRTYTNSAMMDALTAEHGLVYLAAKRLGCEPATIRARCRISSEVRDHLGALRGEFVDTAELGLYQSVLNREPWALAYVLSTLGKDRGYVKEQRLTGADGGPIEVVVKRVAALPGRNGNGQAVPDRH